MKRLSCVALALVMALLAGASAFAQGGGITAQLSGIVVDESGGVLPGVEVTMTNTDTGVPRFVITNERGQYTFPNLPIGPYALTAQLEGFSVYQQTGIVLTVGDARSVNITLRVGGIEDVVTVSADANLVETREIGVSRLIEHEQIVNLPLNRRDANQLILLAGGAVEVGGLTDNRQYPNAVSISVSGGTGNSTQYLVDGGSNNDPQNNTGNPMPFPDALQEFSVESGVRSARYGSSTGATVNAVTRSGTNAFRGTGFAFNRHHSLNAMSYFERTENGGLGRDDGLKRAQWGGTFGGPIVRSKIFFFAGAQVTNERIAPTANDTFVPTEEVRRGDFRRILSAECRGGTARTLGFPFVNNQVDPSLYHPISLRIMNLLPLPDPALDPNGCGRYVLQRPNDSDEQQYIGRVDYQVTNRHRVFGRYFDTSYLHAPLFDINSNPNLLMASGSGLGNDAKMRTFAGGWDWLLSQQLFSSTRITYQYTATKRVSGEGTPTWRTMGANVFQYTNKPGQHLMAGGLWGTAFTGEFYVNTPTISQDFDWQRGAHSLSFGGLWTRPHSDGDGTFASNGNFTFSGLITSGTNNANGGLNMADFVLGLPAAYRQAGSQINNQILHNPGVYVADVWRVNRHLTINSGIRWEPYISAVDQNMFTSHFSRERFDQGLKSVTYPNAPAGFVFPGDPGFEYLAQGKNHKNQWNQWAPRVGMVWDPKGDTVQTIRLGVGHYFDAPKLWTYAHHPLNPPYGNDITAQNPTTCAPPNRNGCPLVFEDPWRFTPGGDPHAFRARQGEPVNYPSSNVAFPFDGAYKSTPVNVTPMQSTQWNLAYARQLPGRMLFDVTYNGSRTSNVWLGYAENPVIYIPGNCAPGQFPGVTAANPACSNTNAQNMRARHALTLLDPENGRYYDQTNLIQLYDQGRGRYAGLRLGLEKRMSRGWSMNANYTLGKCTNQGEPSTNIANSFPVALVDYVNDPRPDPTSNEGPCVNDRRHIFNVSSVLLAPGIGSGIVRVITKDWQVGLIVQARSGSPLTPGVTGNTGLIGGIQRPNLVEGVNPKLSSSERFWVDPATLQWFNMAAFAQNGPGERGNVPKGFLTGPSYRNVDLAFARNLNFATDKRIELRVEAFNVFNLVNWANPNVTLGNENQGRITNTAGDPRIMQLAVKYAF